MREKIGTTCFMAAILFCWISLAYLSFSSWLPEKWGIIALLFPMSVVLFFIGVKLNPSITEKTKI